MTPPPLLTIIWLLRPNQPTITFARLLQSDPLPVTSARLLLLWTPVARLPMLFSARAPLLTTNRLIAPLLPTDRSPPISQRALGLMSRTSFDLAAALRLMRPLTELVRRALSDRTS